MCFCRECLNSLVALGFHFKVLHDYVERETSWLPGQQKSSLIRRAIATGLSGHILLILMQSVYFELLLHCTVHSL